MLTRKFAVLLVGLMLLALVVPAFAQGGVTVEAHQRVNVRSGPAASYAVVGQLNAGDVVNATGRDSTATDWLRIDFNGAEGWVAFFTVYVNGDPDTLPVVEPGAAAAQPEATEAVTDSQPAATEEAAPAATTELGDLYVTAHRRVNVRSGPAASYTVVGVLAAEVSANVTGRDSASNDWLQIDFGGVEGWVAASVVEVTGDPDTAPIVEPGEFAQPAVTAAQQAEAARAEVTYVTRVNANLRAEPAMAAEVLVVIPANTEIQPIARTALNNWIQVTYEGQTGWMITGLADRTGGDLATLPVGQ